MAIAQSALPMMGDGAEMTTSAERKLGDGIIRELYRDPDYIDDAVLQEYVQQLFNALVQAAKARGELSPELQERFAWEILLGRDRTVNAFALPGGYFGVHLGLIAVVGTRDELASVLAHELSHVTQRHIARLMAQQGRQTPLMLGAMILGALAASKNPGAAQALMVGGQALAVQNQLNFSRDMEREADRVGFGLMQPAGFAPRGLRRHVRQAAAGQPHQRQRQLALSAQPPADHAAHRRHAQPHSAGCHAAGPASLEQLMMAARARVLMRPGVDTWRQWVAEPQDAGFAARPRPQRVAAWYAAALSAVQLADHAAARQALRGLQGGRGRATPPPRARRACWAPSWNWRQVMRRRPCPTCRTAWRWPMPARPDAPRRRPELLLRTQALLRTGSAAGMTAPLQTWLATHPGDATAWQALAQVWQQQGQPLRAVRAEAEAQVARYDYAAAVDRFKAGQDLARRGRRGQ